MIRPRNILLVVLLLILAVFGTAWQFGTHLVTPGYIHRTPEQGLHPRDAPPYAVPRWGERIHDPEQDLNLGYEEVEFPAVDGSTLRGWLIPSNNNGGRAVITVHGGEGDRRSFMRHVPMLHSAGYSVLLFDYREHGISDGDSRGIAFGWRANHDVISATAFMKESRGYSRVAVLGTSMGAVSTIIAAAKSDRIDVVIAENPFATAHEVLSEADFFDRLPLWYLKRVAWLTRWHFDVLDEPNAIDVVDRIAPRPLLLMHGTEDKAVGVWQSQKLFDKAGQPKEIWVLEGAEHTALYNLAPEAYEQRVIGFLQKHL